MQGRRLGPNPAGTEVRIATRSAAPADAEPVEPERARHAAITRARTRTQRHILPIQVLALLEEDIRLQQLALEHRDTSVLLGH